MKEKSNISISDYARFKPLDKREISLHYYLRKQLNHFAQQEKKVSIITATNKILYMKNIFDNYIRQIYSNKELIIILNNNTLNIKQWRDYGRKFSNVQVYQLDESVTLGECLNYAIEKSSGDYIAKFDDDDFYGSNYLTDLAAYFNITNASVVGKKSQFVYFESLKQLVLIDSGLAYKYLLVSGGTHVIKREVFNKISFKPRNSGEDTEFNQDCLKAGFIQFAGDPFNYLRIRRTNKDLHTWKINDTDYRSWGTLISKTINPEAFVLI